MTIPTGDPVFIDTNILMYAKLALSPFHQTATQRLAEFEAQGTEFWVSRQVLREYLAAMTKSGVLTGPIPMTSLTADVRYFASRFQVADERATVTDRLLDLLDSTATAGRQVHDANIVATMLDYGVNKLLTHNPPDFARYSNLITVLPLVV